MVRKTLAALMIAAFAGSTGMEFAAMPAAAAMPTGSVPIVNSADPNIQSVAWVYVKKRHGNRYRNKRKGYGYYYGGWYYPRPWWTVNAGPGFVYVEKRHGKRYRYKRAGYGYYYGGYYYPRPWWRPGFSICIGC